MLQRNLHKKSARLMENFPVLAILGARQVGKSTFAKQLGDGWLYLDMENPTDVKRALNEPDLFFADHPEHVILDEAQCQPELFKILRGVIDNDRANKGRFIITGSASFELMSHISESLAGRVALTTMHPLAQNELEQSDRSQFFDLFEQRLTTESISSLLNIESQHEGTSATRNAMIRGGYPEPAIADDPSYRLDWYENYFQTYIQRDILALYPQLDLLKYRRVINMLSQVSHTIINRSDIARSVETSEKSVRDYLDIIEGTYFWRSLPAYQTSKIKTTTKLPKGHFIDTGLCCFLQNIQDAEHLENYPRLGNLFEGFVIEEIIRGMETTNARQLQYSHFRTKAGGEIDLILEGSFGTLPIEVKYGSHTTARQVKALQNFVDIHELPLGIVINQCPRASRISEKVIQLPVSCLFT